MIVYVLGGPSGGIILISSHIETDKDEVEYDGAYGVVSHIAGLRRYTVKIIGKSGSCGHHSHSYRKDAVGLASEFN